MNLSTLVFDWAGTTVDHGCHAPVGVFVEVFARRGVEVTLAEAREPMGTHKREHIRRMCVMPRVAAVWKQAHGAAATPQDVDAMYALATELQIAVLPDFATPIPGVPELIAGFRARGLRIASTTGYNRQMLDVLEAAAREQGYAPDAAVAASEVPHGRPSPYLCWEAAKRVGGWPARGCVKIGDTPVDVTAGLNAGFWTVGVALTGNLVGLSAEGWAALSEEAQKPLRRKARRALVEAGAHYVVDTLAELPAVLDHIELRLERGETP